MLPEDAVLRVTKSDSVALLASSGLCQCPEAHVGGGREGHVGCEAGGGGQAQGVVQRDGRRAGRGEADLMGLNKGVDRT